MRMMGIKKRDFKVHPQVCLEHLVPEDNFYRRLEAKIDLNFVRDLVQDFYAPFGRPSVDPVIFFKLQLIMLFEDIRSERQLMKMVHLNLAFRWYIGYDLDEEIPDHSSLTNIRERYGLPIFRKFFEHIVELCIEAGLVWGKELYFDGTRVEANAAMDSFVRNFEYDLYNHLNVLFPQVQPEPLSRPELDFMEKWVENYRQQPQEWKRDPYQALWTIKKSLTDADATPLREKPRLGYHVHYVVDGGTSRIIVGVLATPAAIQDNQPMLDLTRWARFRWQLTPEIAVGDSKYGSIDNIVGLFHDNILPLTPRADYSSGKEFYHNDRFRYDTEQNVYYCPQNQVLKKQGQYKANRSFVYRGKTRVCEVCHVRSKCTKNKRGRTVHRSFFQSELDQATALRKTEAYTKAMRKRQVWVEPLFGEGKQWHRLSRFRLRRLWRVNIEAFLIASVQNIKRLLKTRHTSKNKPDPAHVMALQMPQSAIQIVFLLLMLIVVGKVM
jgi:transposase